MARSRVEGTMVENVEVRGTRRLPVFVPDAATYAVQPEDSGAVLIVPNLTADIVITLPTPERGLEYEFMYGGAAADAQDWAIDTGSDTNFYKGGVLHGDSDAGGAGIELVPVRSDGNSNSILNVLTPDVGTSIRVFSDGTLWYLTGQAVSATAPTLADQV